MTSTPLRLLTIVSLVVTLLPACSSDPVDEDLSATIAPVFERMGSISFSTDRDPTDLPAHEAAALQATRRAAVSAATGVVKATTDWRDASTRFEALARDRRFVDDYVSQQIISAVALQGILLHDAPATEEAARQIAHHVQRLVENDGNAFVAMVEGIDKARGHLDAATVGALEAAVAARFEADQARECEDCPGGVAEAMARTPSPVSGPTPEEAGSVFDRMPPALRARALQAADRERAARERIRGWSS